MSETDTALSESETHALRASKELKSHLTVLDTLASPALGVLAVASGIYTYLGVSTLLEDNGAITFFAAIAYSIAVSVGIFVFFGIPGATSGHQDVKSVCIFCIFERRQDVRTSGELGIGNQKLEVKLH